MSDRLASERQLWRLNKEGYVCIREEQGEPLTSADVHPLVSSIMEAYQLAKAASDE